MQSHDLVFTPLPIKEGDKAYIDSFNSDTQKDSERQDNLTELTHTFMLPTVFLALILTRCLTKGNCISYDELKDLKIEFAINLYRHASEAENRTNLVISPASVAISLEMLQFGAQGNTFTELHNALGYNIHDQDVQDMLHEVYEGAADSGQGAVAQLACSLFVHTGVQLSPRFAAHATHWANSSLQQADFTNPNQTAAQIQGWITNNLADGDVHGVPSEGAASPLSRVAVVSTMYFKSTWLKKFSFTNTQVLPFTVAEGSTLKVPTMHHTAEVNYGNCSCSTFMFSIQSLFDLKTVFSALGIRDAFDPIAANFKGISGERYYYSPVGLVCFTEQAGLYISEAIHKAKIEVTEDGTKASGATAMVLLKRSRTPIFKADRPFTFFLRQANTGTLSDAF
ncbi:UNVERIFIED_CONTAM: hypothetical protein H355_012576 [Colinus virginianus]|nr:hypothetical protein H355_012576 [Colinus virginianus]